jgi:hypothetical protein
MVLWRGLNTICVDRGILTFGCVVRFNPWYVGYISGLNSCENQLPCSWLIVELFSLLWVKNCKCTFCLWAIVFCWAIMLFFMAKPSALVILHGSCSWKIIHGGHKWHSILKYNYCTARSNIVHTSKIRIYKPDEPGVFIVALLCTVHSLWQTSPTNQSYERWLSAELCVPSSLGNI